MAPLSNEIRPVTSCCPPHFGPAVPEVNSVWFKLFIYDHVKSGPPSLLLVKGTRLRWLPKMFEVTVVIEKKKCCVACWNDWSEVSYLRIGHFRVTLCLCFKTSLRAKPSYENEFDLHENGPVGEFYYQMNGFARRLVLKQRHRVTRKWPIAKAFFMFPMALEWLSFSCPLFILFLSFLSLPSPATSCIQKKNKRVFYNFSAF